MTILRTALIILALTFLVTGAVGASATLNKRNYKKLQTIHKLIERNQLGEAKKQLEHFLSVKHNAYTQAIFLQTAAHVAIEQERYNQAITYLEQADLLNALPGFVNRNIVYNLVQLYAQKGDLDKSLKMLERWLKESKLSASKQVTSEQHFFAATLYGRKKKYTSAEKHIKKAIKLSVKPNESWFQLLISLYLEQKKYIQAISAYQNLIKRFPNNKDYWHQLSGLYLQTNKYHQALAVMELAEKQGILSTEKEFLRLADLYLYTNIPLSSAQLLQKKLDSGAIEPTIKNLMKLTDSLILAQEYPQAIKVLEKIAQLDMQNGQYQLRMGRLLMEQGKWLAAYQQFIAAQNKNLHDPGENYLLQGISAFYAKKQQKAKIAFKKATKFKKHKEKASIWLEQLE